MLRRKVSDVERKIAELQSELEQLNSDLEDNRTTLSNLPFAEDKRGNSAILKGLAVGRKIIDERNAPYQKVVSEREAAVAEKLNEAILEKIRIKTTLFHEGLELIKRDRSAAYFSEEDGARVLISSEIGSEGRNFQFASNLVLYDLGMY